MADTNDLIRREDAMMAVAERINQIGYNHNPLVLSIMQAIVDVPSAQHEIVRCMDCRWGRENWRGNIECLGGNAPIEYHSFDWFCPNGERKEDG